MIASPRDLRGKVGGAGGARPPQLALLVREAGSWRRQELVAGQRFGASVDVDLRLAGAPVGSWMRFGRGAAGWFVTGSSALRLDGEPVPDAGAALSPNAVLRLGSAALVALAVEAESTAGMAPAHPPLLRAGQGLSGSEVVFAAWAELLLCAQEDCPLLVLGETGTGKELAARLLHAASPRSRGPMVAISASSLPRETLHAELFGARRGAYTGCVADREGAFSAAHGGTLLLDEVGELDLHAQAALLRVLESGEITPLGGRPRRVDVRLVCATHRDLDDMVAAGTFRLDLLHRIAVACVQLPPLRARGDDAAALLATQLGQPLSPEVKREVRCHSWPGNLRELRNIVRRLEISLGGAPCQLEDLRAALRPFGAPPRPGPVPSPPPTGDRRDAVRLAMAAETDGTAAWRRSGLPRATYFRLARAMRQEAFS